MHAFLPFKGGDGERITKIAKHLQISNSPVNNERPLECFCVVVDSVKEQNVWHTLAMCGI